MASKVKEWVVHRFGLKIIYDHFLNRRVPRSPWYYGDGTTLLTLLGVQVLTGALLSLTYSPTPDTAYQSIQDITEQQTLGWFIRGLHYWSGGLMVVMLFIHLFRQILVAGYKYPREGTWLIGVFMFFGVITMSYTGYLLRWDERAVHAIGVALHMLHNVPLIGDHLVQFAQGGPELGARTLTRFFSLHVIWLPLIILTLAGFHLYLIVVRGTTSGAEKRQPIHSVEEQEKVYKAQAHSEKEGEDFYPVTTFKTGVMATAVFTLAVVLTLTLGPARLYPEANLVDRSFPAEEWWFWWYSGLIALLPPAIAPIFYVLFPVALFLLLVLLPFVDRGPYRGMRRRPVAVIIVVVCVLAMLFLTDLRLRSPWTGWPDHKSDGGAPVAAVVPGLQTPWANWPREQAPPPVPEGVKLSAKAEKGRFVFMQYGCINCHSISGYGRKVGPDLAKLSTPRSFTEIRNFTLRPPKGVPMPAYEGHITEEHLDQVVEFCHVAQIFPRD